jgi:hypothetical protein
VDKNAVAYFCMIKKPITSQNLIKNGGGKVCTNVKKELMAWAFLVYFTFAPCYNLWRIRNQTWIT